MSALRLGLRIEFGRFNARKKENAVTYQAPPRYFFLWLFPAPAFSHQPQYLQIQPNQRHGQGESVVWFVFCVHAHFHCTGHHFVIGKQAHGGYADDNDADDNTRL